MSSWWWFLVAAGVVVALWTIFVAFLLVVGRREEARAIAGFIPDCLVLAGRLLADPRVSRRNKLLLLALLGYLALPFDLVPVVPVAGQLDDVIVTAFVLRGLIRSGGEPLIREHWPGPELSLRLILSLD